MALKGKVSEDFFHAIKQHADPKNETVDNSLVNEQTSLDIKPHTHFRIFDNPLEQLDQNDKINTGQSRDKVGTKLGQSRDKVGTKLGQSRDKVGTKLGQAKGKLGTNQGQSGDKVETQLGTSLRQFSDEINELATFSSLVGLQREIVLFIYEQCKVSRDKTTAPLSIEYLSTSCKTTRLAAKKTTQRLEKKGSIIRGEYKNGRGGWTIYGLPEPIFREVLHTETQDKLRINQGQSGDKVETQPRTSNASSSSSLFSNNKTTTTSEAIVEIDAKWQATDLGPLVEFGFTQAHLLQIIQQGTLGAEVVQNSIYAFAFDLKHNHKGNTLKTNPVNYFMGILRNGQPYAPPGNYESPQDEAMRIYVERQRKLEEKRESLEKETIELAFKEWLVTLTDDNKNNIMSPLIRNLKTEQPKLAELKSYFIKEIWADKHVQIIQQII